MAGSSETEVAHRSECSSLLNSAGYPLTLSCWTQCGGLKVESSITFPKAVFSKWRTDYKCMMSMDLSYAKIDHGVAEVLC